MCIEFKIVCNHHDKDDENYEDAEDTEGKWRGLPDSVDSLYQCIVGSKFFGRIRGASFGLRAEIQKFRSYFVSGEILCLVLLVC